MALIRLRHILIIIGCLFSSFLLHGQGACDDDSRWGACLLTKTETEDGRVHYDTVYYTPSEFFGPDGALVPDYNPEDSNQVTVYYFSDTSCTTDDWVLEAEILTTGNFGNNTVLGLDAFFEPVFDWRDFRSSRPAPMERRIEIPVEVKPKSQLRNEYLSTLAFAFHDGILYYYRGGNMYRKEAYDICKIHDIAIYWEKAGGGAVKSLRFQDNTNNKTYYENFSDCKNMQLFEDCPPPPKVELRARVELPTCQNPTLRFYSESNLLEDFHWIDPYGREFSRDQNPVITNLSSMKSGTYWVWGKYDRCSEPVAVRVDVEIVEPELVSDTVELVSCASEKLYIGGKLVTENGFYSDTVRTKNGYCDSVTVYNVYIVPPLSKHADVESCGRVETQLQVDSIPDAEYQWRPASFLSATDRFNPFVSTSMSLTYHILVRRGACVDSTTLDVYVRPIPSIDRVELFPEKKEIVINPVRMSSDYSYSLDGEQWQSSPSFVDDIPVGTSLAYIKDLYGCESSLPFYFLIPIYPEDHMSPNGDGIKDTWEVENLGYYKHYSVRIYDRYGKLLVEYHDEYPGWDGVYNGADMPSTDYWYVISVDELDYEVSGHFTLLRR